MQGEMLLDSQKQAPVKQERSPCQCCMHCLVILKGFLGSSSLQQENLRFRYQSKLKLLV